MSKFLIPVFIVIFAVSACKRLPDVQGKGALFFQGIWSQDSIASSKGLLSFTKHRFKISCDSFYVDLTTHSKVNYYSDSCFNNGIWKEYAKGVYEVRSDSIFFVGTFTKENYRQKISGCYQIGQYIKSFKILKARQNSLVLESTDNQRVINLILKETISCIPKAL